MHENMYIANITDFNPLKPGDIVIALTLTGTKVVLAEGQFFQMCTKPVQLLMQFAVTTMYTKNTMHDWIPMALSVRTPSYICVSVYSPLAGTMFTLLACPKLACGSFLQIPHTHLLFHSIPSAPR